MSDSSAEMAYLTGPSDPELSEQTLGQRFAEIVSRFPTRTAIKDVSSQLSYSELDQYSDALALGLLDLQISHGDRVAISLGNCVANAVISYACFKIGAIVTPLNPAYTPGQVIAALNHVAAKCYVLSTDIVLPHRQPKSAAPLLSDVLQGTERDDLALLLVDNCTRIYGKHDFAVTARYEQVLSSNRGKRLPIREEVKNGDYATIQFTSGTTSSPKAACLTHRNVLNNGIFVGLGMELTELDIVCCPPPLYHCFGLVLGIIATMAWGACIIFPSEAFDAAAVVKSIRQNRPTTLYGVPTMFLAELEHISKDPLTHDDIKHLRTGVIGGSPIPASLRLTLHNDLNLTGLTNCYGLTESSPIICQTTSTDTQEQKLTTVGRMLPHTSAKIVARDDPNRTLQRGERGELLISGYCVMAGYWKDPARTSEALVVEKRDDGSEKVWLRSGDEALFQSDGYIRITGRIKDIIIRGGENIYPPEIENVLLQHPVISNASVVGLPDPKYGEVVSAFIILKDGFRGIQSNNGRDDSSAELVVSKTIIQGWVQERLPRMLVPKCVFWIEQMPLTASGKVEKYKLRELGIHLLNSRDPIEPSGV